MIKVRRATISEIDWINQCYAEVEFVPSHFEKEIIAVAEYNGQKAGLGRLVSIDENNLELGGMYVFDTFQGKGIPKKITEFLLNQLIETQNVYCLPFQHLLPLYKFAFTRFGFVLCTDFSQAPKKVFEKFQWCQTKYSKPVSLLVLKRTLQKQNSLSTGENL
jgi:N-acetylglutamate synthase-like GNAT family acetyltransferase